MKNLFFKPIGVFTIILLTVFLLNFTACQKETTTVSFVNQKVEAAKSNDQIEAPTNSNINERVPFELSTFIPCANGGVGETVNLSGDVHLLITFTINDNNIKGTLHYQYYGIKGIGTFTGDKYQLTGVTQNEFKGSFINGQYETTGLNHFKFIEQGTGVTYSVSQLAHFTFNANGIFTSNIISFTFDCN